MKGPELQLDVFDTQTRERMREFIGGHAWNSISRNGAPRIDPRDEKLNRATQLFPTCGNPLKNAYEVGVFTRDEQDADRTIGRAVDKFNITPRPADRRAMIFCVNASRPNLRINRRPMTRSTNVFGCSSRQHGAFVNPTVPTPVPPNQQKKVP